MQALSAAPMGVEVMMMMMMMHLSRASTFDTYETK
jgi:hypothetical protein